ncbi:hypothetical protein ETD86_46485 [Nonomuraea turkmeniaca]|uniref:Uncharacterized protein n=1 Tax=Nonomuraea turkmeniaca TaxID=103838 RepID=A0A5S4FI73_9ACTN|nr:hypothetical protein [Nonomuraea turkmeniaca]TMR08735.1 hypothetical protein ETD86_46485 [Nonomuraea turkmeniaca]
MAAGSANTAVATYRPIRAAPVHSIEELAERLRPYESGDTSESQRADSIFGLCTGVQGSSGLPAEPRGFPVHAARLRTDPPLEVRFLQAPDTATARALTNAATRIATRCAGPPAAELGADLHGEVTVAPFRRGGWSGVQVVSNVRVKRPTWLFYHPVTVGRVAASRGVWIVDLAWEVRGGFGYAPRSWTTEGLRVAEWALSLTG